MDSAQLGAMFVALTSLAGVLLAYFKFKPGQRERLDMDTAEGTLNLAQGSINLVTSTLEAQFTRMAAEQQDMARRMKDVEDDFEKYREASEARHAELATAMRGERAQVKHLEGEVKRRDDAIAERDTRIDELSNRVDSLELEVASLRGTDPRG